MVNEFLTDHHFPLHDAAYSGNLSLLCSLIENGLSINQFDELGWTPLHAAAYAEHYHIVEFLLKNGADVNAHDERKIGETPLGEISSTCSYKMAELLVKAGADPCIPGWMGITALDRARKRKKPEGLKVCALLESCEKKA